MIYTSKPLAAKQIENLKEKGSYTKITIDLVNQTAVIDTPLHADGEKILLNKGGEQENIWGGGVNLNTIQFDANAVLNIRPNLNNPSMEIIDPDIRKNFLDLAKYFFKNLE
jgi:hypothetical protein